MEPKTITKFPSLDQHLARLFITIQEKLFPDITCYIAGGSARKLYLKQELDESDIDIWFKSKADLLRASEILYKMPAAVIKAETTNGMTYVIVGGIKGSPFTSDVKIQLISRNYYPDEISAVFGDFDFTICQVIYNKGRLLISEAAERDLRDMILRKNDGYTSALSTARFMKYMAHGYTPTLALFNAYFVDGREEIRPGDFAIDDMELYYA